MNSRAGVATGFFVIVIASVVGFAGGHKIGDLVRPFVTSARAQPAPTMPLVPVGYCQLTSIDSSTLVSSCSGGIPTGASVAYVAAEAQAVRYRDDGTAPSATVGFPVAVNAPFLYVGTLGALRVISQTAGAKLNVLFYKVP